MVVKTNCDGLLDCRSDADVALILDASGSVGPLDFYTQLTFVQDLITDLPAATSVHVAMETFSSKENVHFYLHDYETKLGILNGLSVPYLYGGTTNTGYLNFLF